MELQSAKPLDTVKEIILDLSPCYHNPYWFSPQFLFPLPQEDRLNEADRTPALSDRAF